MTTSTRIRRNYPTKEIAEEAIAQAKRFGWTVPTVVQKPDGWDVTFTREIDPFQSEQVAAKRSGWTKALLWLAAGIGVPVCLAIACLAGAAALPKGQPTPAAAEVAPIILLPTSAPAAPSDQDRVGYLTWAGEWSVQVGDLMDTFVFHVDQTDLVGLRRDAENFLVLCRDPALQSPPASLGQANDYLIRACAEYNQGSRLIIRALDENNPELIYQATEHWVSGTSLIDMATASIR
jgi:hypothetical protein